MRFRNRVGGLATAGIRETGPGGEIAMFFGIHGALFGDCSPLTHP